ncbi:PAS domain S-box protein [Marinifilum sp.]|uniref:PAS domain-containing protein n=1 Tax=Marinifilum sp. TaxID=2033137 RepID=UPI003BABD6B7
MTQTFRESSEHLQQKIKQLEAELKNVKQSYEAKSGLFKHLFRNAKNRTQDNLSVIDTDFTLVEVNNNQLKQIGKKRADIIGQKCYKAIYGLQKECEECIVKDVVASKKANRFLKSSEVNNSINFEEKLINPVLNEHGEVERLVIESKDISGYYQLVDKVGQRDDFFKNIFESAGDAFLIHDSKGNFLDFGSNLPSLLDYKKEEFKKLRIDDIDDPTYSIKFDARQQQMKNKDHVLFETELIKKSGKRIPVEASATLIPLQGERIFFVSIRNLEKRKVAEDKLKISEKRFRTLVENASDIIMRFNREYRFLFVNNATVKLLHIEKKEFIGKRNEDIGFPKSLCEFWEREMEFVFQSSEINVVEFSIELNGELKYFDWQLIPEFDDNGKVATIMAIARDITTRKLNEKALEEAIKTKDKFFSIIAHDLKNPFNAMLPIVQILKENHTHMKQEQLTSMIDLIDSSLKQEYSLLNNLLEWSRAQTGAMQLKTEKIKVRELVDSNLLLHRVKAESKNIEVKINSETDFEVLADKYTAETVIRNLISNAFKFTNIGGTININIGEKNGEIYCSIEDNGVGISTENQQKLFRTDTNCSCLGTLDETGTGLGLILCKEFIEKNGGSILVESELGVGSKFTICLPKAT